MNFHLLFAILMVILGLFLFIKTRWQRIAIYRRFGEEGTGTYVTTMTRKYLLRVLKYMRIIWGMFLVNSLLQLVVELCIVYESPYHDTSTKVFLTMSLLQLIILAFCIRNVRRINKEFASWKQTL